MLWCVNGWKSTKKNQEAIVWVLNQDSDVNMWNSNGRVSAGLFVYCHLSGSKLLLRRVSLCLQTDLLRQVSNRPVLFVAVYQVVWGGAVGDQHAGWAAVPGPVQRAGPQVRHGRRLPGPAWQLRRQTVSTGAVRHIKAFWFLVLLYC